MCRCFSHLENPELKLTPQMGRLSSNIPEPVLFVPGVIRKSHISWTLPCSHNPSWSPQVRVCRGCKAKVVLPGTGSARTHSSPYTWPIILLSHVRTESFLLYPRGTRVTSVVPTGPRRCLDVEERPAGFKEEGGGGGGICPQLQILRFRTQESFQLSHCRSMGVPSICRRDAGAP